MFQRISDYTELLFPDNLLREGSVIQQMIEMIPEEDWQDAVQIIGWLYQFYNIEPKAEVFAKSGKISKEEIPAATQLFTPDWIVRYMVENSLGRLWVEGHPNDGLKSEWKYYLDESEQEVNVQEQLDIIRKEYASISPEQIKCIDPCSGSGHILAYMFDVLMQIYEAYGYTAREAVRSIVENNIYGLDIDDRAAQLAYFSVMMKARQYDRRFLTRKDENDNPDVPQPHIHAIVESNGIDPFSLDYFIDHNPNVKVAINSIIKEMSDAKEYGSILKITPVDFSLLYERFDAIKDDINISREIVLNDLLPLVQVAEILSQKHDVTVTNPPYMAVSAGTPKLNKFIRDYYPDSKTDLFAVFMERCGAMTKKNGFQAMVTMHSWMFLSSYEKLRGKLQHTDLINMAHLGARAFEEIGGEVVQTTSFVFRRSKIPSYRGTYCRLIEANSQQGKEDAFLKKENLYYTSQDDFAKVSGQPVAYWIPASSFDVFSEKLLSDVATASVGIQTGDNNKFLHFWWEVAFDDIKFDAETVEDSFQERKWFPYNKGGEFRKWYGNDTSIINWRNDGEEIKASSIATGHHYQQYADILKFKPLVTWSRISTGTPAFRYKSNGFLSDMAGFSLFASAEELKGIIAFCNSKVARYYLDFLAPTLNIMTGQVLSMPYIIDVAKNKELIELVEEAIDLVKSDWDDFEVSWDFKTHPLVRYSLSGAYAWGDNPPQKRLSSAYKAWESVCNGRFDKLRVCEERINQVIIEAYHLENELSHEVKDDEISIRKADVARDVKSLISYAVGCMFGRYSLDEPGLSYAGGTWNNDSYLTFDADKDSIIPICTDEYFEDDIVGRFVRFIEIVYGKENLNDNLKFIADSLGGKGNPKDVIRDYFINEFYKDHCSMYSGTVGKRPIYWQFDSGKKGGFRALIYMHRYQPDTIARMRTDYVHEQQARYRTAIADLEQRITAASTSERVKLNKKLKALQDQATEIQGYEEKIHHLADQYISIDLDDGVKTNYDKFKDVLAKIK